MSTDFAIDEALEGNPLWPLACEQFPQAMKWKDDPADDGEYHFFIAADAKGEFLGGAVIDTGKMRFGPLAEKRVGYLEHVEVAESARCRGIGKALVVRALECAWKLGAQHVRGQVDYDNSAGIALYESLGFAIVPLEDPDAAEPERRYLVVAANPASMPTAGRSHHRRGRSPP